MEQPMKITAQVKDADGNLSDPVDITQGVKRHAAKKGGGANKHSAPEANPDEGIITPKIKDNLKEFVRKLDLIDKRKDEVKLWMAKVKEDEKAIYGEAKSYGIDSAQLKNVMKFRRQNPDKARAELGMYLGLLEALGIGI